MSGIIGQINKLDDHQWLERQISKAVLDTGELMRYCTKQFCLHQITQPQGYEEVQPFYFGDVAVAVNGTITSEAAEMLHRALGDIGFKNPLAAPFWYWNNTNDWSLLDNQDFSFEFWIHKGDYVYFGSKDYPFYLLERDNSLRFSSFSARGFIQAENTVNCYDLTNSKLSRIYKFKQLRSV